MTANEQKCSHKFVSVQREWEEKVSLVKEGLLWDSTQEGTIKRSKVIIFCEKCGEESSVVHCTHEVH